MQYMKKTYFRNGSSDAECTIMDTIQYYNIESNIKIISLAKQAVHTQQTSAI